MILPLGIVTTLRPVRQVPEHLGIAELYADHDRAHTLGTPRPGLPRSWRDTFLYLDRALKVYERFPNPGLRRRAMEAAEAWLLERMATSEGLGAIFPPMVYMLIVLQRCLGYPDHHPVVVKAHKDLTDFYIREGDTIRLQPCVSPVWDTGIALHALAEAGLTADDEPARRGTAVAAEQGVPRRPATGRSTSASTSSPRAGSSSSKTPTTPTPTTRPWP